MTTPASSQTGIRDALVFRPDGTFRRISRLTWSDGVFHIGDVPHPDQAVSVGLGSTNSASVDLIDGRDRWVIPGVVDAHTHLAWSDFDEADRAARTAEDVDIAVRGNLARTLAAGVTSARDAGGAPASLRRAVASGALTGPRLSLSVDLITRAVADAAGGIAAAVERAVDAGAEWIKLIGTDGVAHAASVGFDPHFSRAEFGDAVHRAESAGARVMVHAWGGDAITWAIEAGASSIEHGIFLTQEQAQIGASHGTTLVPTLHIYRLVADMIVAGQLPAAFGPRVANAIAVHPVAVCRARDAGMPIALGTDFGTSAQHGHNLVEIAELVSAGLSVGEALVAATSAGAALLGRAPGAPLGHVPIPDVTPAASIGQIVEGAVADAVVLRRDPADPETFGDPTSVVAVIQGGRQVATNSPGLRHEPVPQ